MRVEPSQNKCYVRSSAFCGATIMRSWLPMGVFSHLELVAGEIDYLTRSFHLIEIPQHDPGWLSLGCKCPCSYGENGLASPPLNVPPP